MKWWKFGKKRKQKLSIDQINRLLSDHDFERYKEKHPDSSRNEMSENMFNKSKNQQPASYDPDQDKDVGNGRPSRRRGQVRTGGLIDMSDAANEDTQFVDDFEAADQDFNKYTQTQYVRKFHFPYLASRQERSNLYKAHVSIRDARQLLMERLAVTGFLGIGFGLATAIFFKKGIILSLLVALIVGGITWYALSSSIRSNYSNFKIDRQIAFNLFEKILAPNLHRVREGSNLTNILEVVSKQLPQPMYRHYVDRLVIDMQMKPGAKEPFDRFAHTFSGGENAEFDALVFTNALYQLTQGKDSIDTITQLLRTSERQLGEQQGKIMKLKQRPFKLVEYLMFSTFFPFTIAYYGTTIASYISSFHM